MTARAAQALRTGLRRFTPWIGVASLALWGATAAAQDISVAPSSIPTPALGAPYSVTFVGSNGVPPYQFLVSAGLLPAGLSLSGTGDLTGTPTHSAPYSFTITVSDALGRERDLLGTGTVTGALTITPPPVLVANTAYSGPIEVSGGTGPYTFTIDSGSLPPGMSLGPNGLLSGTPTTPGLYTLVIQVTDANGLSSTLTLNLQVMGVVSTGIPVNDPWMLVLAALGLGWLARRKMRQQPGRGR